MKTIKNITVMNVTLQDIITHRGTVILKYTIEYPKFSSRNCNLSIEIINKYYEKSALEYKKYILTTMQKTAIEDYENSVKNGYPIHEYEALQTYMVTYNQSCTLSLYMDRYEYTGGAHGITPRQSQTWNTVNGKQIRLKSLFPDNKNYIFDLKKEIILQIQEQIEAGNNYYFDNYEELVNQTFNPKSFYLTPKALVVYFQQYDIAPYVSGIVEFYIPYSKVGAALPYCVK